MSRRSTPASKIDEQTFAVRVRIAVPEQGLRCLNEVHEWLRKNAPGAYAVHSTRAMRDALYLHVNDLAVAVECVNHFGLDVYGLPKQTP